MTIRLIYTAPMNSASRLSYRSGWYIACVIALLASGSGCGYRGDLYKPDPQADMIEVRKPGDGSTSSSSDKKRRDAQQGKQGTGDSPPAEDAKKDE
jgi:predicted small lipoprotein YifL